MRITIDISAANDPDAHRWLDRMLDRIEDGWHVWDLTETPDADAIAAATCNSDPGRQGNRLRDLLIASTRRGAWTPAPHGRRVRVTAHPAATDELAPEQACRLADEPLVILVENRDSDGAFVGRVVTELDKSLHGVWKREGGPIRFDSVGGAGQMRQEVEKRAGAVPYRPRLPQPAARTVELLKRWFWVTSFTGWFGGVNTAQAKRDLEEIRHLAEGKSETLNVVDPDMPAQPFPERFDARSARVRAFLLYLASLGPRSLRGGDDRLAPGRNGGRG